MPGARKVASMVASAAAALAGLGQRPGARPGEALARRPLRDRCAPRRSSSREYPLVVFLDALHHLGEDLPVRLRAAERRQRVGVDPGQLRRVQPVEVAIGLTSRIRPRRGRRGGAPARATPRDHCCSVARACAAATGSWPDCGQRQTLRRSLSGSHRCPRARASRQTAGARPPPAPAG